MSQAPEQFDPGIGTHFKQRTKRIINKDGSFNVDKRGARFRPYDAYLFFINMTWGRFLLVLTGGYLLMNVLFAFIYLLLGEDALSHISENGMHSSNRGNYEEAVSYYDKAIEADTEHLDAYLKRAFALSAMGSYERAVADYSRIIDLNPNMVLANVSRGSVLNKLKRFEEALVDFDKVIALDPENSEAYNNRGWAKKGLNDKEGACADWKRSKKMSNDETRIILKNNQC